MNAAANNPQPSVRRERGSARSQASRAQALWRVASRNARRVSARHSPRTRFAELPPMIRLAEYDDRLLRQLVRYRAGPVTFALRALCRAFDPDILTLAIVALFLAGPVGQGLANHMAMALIITSGVVGTVKTLVRRARPAEELQAHAPPDRFSFPSGHTAAAFSVALSIFALAPFVVPVLIVCAIFAGYARMYLGVHYPVDVAAGAAVGLTVGSIVALF